jgi:O-antigen/teichoic acid export membrane protein
VSSALTARARALLQSGAGKAFITLGDQGIVSATNFLTAVLVGRLAGQDALGLYFLGFQGILIFVQNTQMSLVSAAYIVYGPRLNGEEFRRYTGSTLMHSLLLCVIAGMGMLVAGLVFRWRGAPSGMEGLDGLLLVLAVTGGCWLLREYARQVCFARLNAHAAIALDAFVFVGQMGGLYALGRAGLLTAHTAYAVIGVMTGVGALAWLFSRRHIFAPRLADSWPDFRKNWKYTRWIFAMNLTYLGSMQIYPWLLGIFRDTEALGVLGACGTVIFLSNPFIIGMSNFLGPKCVHAYTTEGVAGMRRVVRTATIFFAVTLGGFSVIMLAGGGAIMRLLFNEPALAEHGLVLGIWAVGQLAWAVRVPAEYGMNALERPDVGFKALLLMLMITVTAGVWLTWEYGPLGVAIGIASGQTAACAYSRWIFARETRARSAQGDAA